MTDVSSEVRELASREYQYGFVTDLETDVAPRGLNEDVIRLISAKKNEPDWMLEWRLKAYRGWLTMEEPRWQNVRYAPIDYQDIIYYAAPKPKVALASLDEVDPEVLAMFDKLGISLAEQGRLSGVAVDAIVDSVSVATTFKEKLAEAGVIFCSFSEAVQRHPELVRRYLGTVVPRRDNFFAALNSAVFSDGSFCYVPKGVRCPMELSTYFRINAADTGQFERTLIIAEEGAYVSYLEGCTAPMRDTNQLHAAVVELVALDDAQIKYSTVQNWYPGDAEGRGGIYNFVTKRGKCAGVNSKISWTQVETGSAITWKYPGVVLQGDGSVGEFYSVALTANHQQADTGTKMIHVGRNTRSTIVSKGICPAGHTTRLDRRGPREDLRDRRHRRSVRRRGRTPLRRPGVVSRVLLLLPTETYRAADFLAAASRLAVDVVIGSERRQTMAGSMGDRAVVVPMGDVDAAVGIIAALHERRPLDAVLAVDDQGLMVAAAASQRLGMTHNPPDAVAATRDKAAMRARLAASSVPQPDHRVVMPGGRVSAAAAEIGYPYVVKPVSRSGSQGVIRVDDRAQAVAAEDRIRSIVGASEPLLVERFVPGAEVAVEGLLEGGTLEVLAVFDKPDPLDGPFFEETIYVTPSRQPPPILAALEATVASAAAALGLREGPVHAELRIGPAGELTVLEVAARSIGGLCARALRFGAGVSLEEVVIRHAVGAGLAGLSRETQASGVMMLPIRSAGVLEGVSGLSDALGVDGVVGVEISIPVGRPVIPLPEGDRYLGFVFARGPDPADVELALRRAEASLDVVVRPAPGQAGPDSRPEG